MVHTAEFRRRTPEKWVRLWNQLYSGNRILVLIEPLISEIFYQIEKLSSKAAAQKYIFRIKGMQNTDVVPHADGDKIALLAGEIRYKHRQRNVSLVDSYIIATAIRENAAVYTTDHGVRDSAREEKCEVQYLPKESL
jgi:predicted nucleic acid-binding protein